ncbi:hypothetical protein PMJ89_00145 [Pseudomonas aeruginosa]|uniref:hypothetical protein n=1 Tax=Pseudomonas aeruginosa TaxID=287 RepID=UPI0024949ADC|nr:hypothetical protein [Pseudomonas aeruginosa]WCI96341.1 hypothetical protein PMJ89_00145 [Pseudomonas aeruginosa]
MYNNLNHAAAESLLKEIKDCRAAGGCGEEKLQRHPRQVRKLSAERSNAIGQCASRQCVDDIVDSSIRMDDPVSKELLSLLRQTTYDTPGLLQGNPDAIVSQTPNPSGWGDLCPGQQLAFAKNLKEGWLTPEETADLDRWNASTSWLDRTAGRQLDPQEKAYLLGAGGAAAMGFLGGECWRSRWNKEHIFFNKRAPKYPQGFKDIKNGTQKYKINNQDVLESLRGVEPGKWVKVYRDGFDSAGNKISVHYFQSQSGKVFDVKVKSGWSN